MLHRIRRLLAALLVVAVTAGSLPAAGAYASPIPAVPEFITPEALLAGLPRPAADLPVPDPLAAVLSGLTPPDAAFSAGAAGTGPVTGGFPTAPGAVPMPEPPPAPDPLDHPVNLATGGLALVETDLALPGNGFGLTIIRQYSSREPQDGPFGYGWRHNLGGRLTLYGDYQMVEFRADGTTAVYPFVQDDPNGYVYEFDGDPLINYDLTKGHYEPAGDGSTLERVSATDYRVTRPDGLIYIYNGYIAPWREGQPVTAGQLAAVADAYGNTET